MAIVSLTLLALQLYDTATWQWTLFIVYNISYTVALYALYLFYQSTKDILRDYSPVWKFFAVKSVVFMTYWQALLVESGMPGVSEAEAKKWNVSIVEQQGA